MKALLGAAVAAIGLATALGPMPAMAQGARTITLVSGFAAGTAPDTLARILAEAMQRAGNASVVVENVPGAGGQVASARVARAAADGATVLLGEVGSVAIAPFAFATLPYDPARDFTYVSEVARTTFAFAVPAQGGPATMAAFVEAAKKADRTLLGTFGVTSPAHIAAELFAQSAGFKGEPVHYRAVADGIGDIARGQTAGAFLSVPLASAQIRSGGIRAIVQTGETRSPMLPDVPTAREAGMPDLTIASWFVLMVPAATPAATVAEIHRAAAAAMKDPAALERLRGAGFEAVGSSPDEVRAMIARERDRWKPVIERAGIRITN
ncbi:Bug family tripartite tricarboxylate transporter substrate binding protein [Phreatobacter oligotrophus]|uniref:Tripartite-type tricarboxylate transporter receptor subunit TctC n=1 Tax=Phreatobacter oligotrophus TaxID=1122261 RepID=A0A2T4ZH76_9HYPH|nr:tripartite tricarboxylate transporter substrate binding protein [Phreatobacter oligotrophus]PTM61262.1 tripartite-type tricarboxylate transporter receptor subunit TctC [Phreatobacter oligotrophus]